jgi:hypothetical protein
MSLHKAFKTLGPALTETVVIYEQLISNGGRFKPAFAQRDKKQTMIDIRKISTNWFKNQLCPSTGLSRLWALR